MEDASLADITEAEESPVLAYLQDDAVDVNPYVGIEEVYAS